MRAKLAVVVVAGVAVVAGLSRGAAPAWASPPKDACSLLTQSQLSSVLSVSMGASRPLFPTGCRWDQQVKLGDPEVIVIVSLMSMKLFTNSRALLTGNRITATTMGGIGDDAYYLTGTAGGLTTLMVKKGDAEFSVRVWGAGAVPGQIKPQEQALAQMVMAKL